MDAIRLPAPGGFEQGGPAEGDGRASPVMEQYLQLKAAHADCLLFYRMGDFYELFFEDAEVAARALGIVLTKRGKHLGRDIPMCGVPVHRADEYLQRLIKAGHRVAVCEQIEDPAEARRRGGKSIVRRDIVRLVTPGTLTEDTLLDPKRNNYLAAIARARGSTEADSRFGLAWIDISTGEFRLGECDRIGLAAGIGRLEPSEIIVSDALYGDIQLLPELRTWPGVTPMPRDVFDSATAERRLAAYFGLATTSSFGALSRLELTAAAACISYVERTQLGARPPLSPPSRESQDAALLIDHATRSNLELVRTLGGERSGTLLAAIDRTVTGAGARLLAQRLAAPLTDQQAIARRHDAVDFFATGADARADLRRRLRAGPDLSRALARLVVGRGGPRDLAAIRDGILAAGALAGELERWAPIAEELAQAATALRAPDQALAQRLCATLCDELPHLKRDGGFIRTGYDASLDEARALRDESRRVIAALQARYADLAGVRSLKIRHNNVLGYFVEVTAQHGEKLLSLPQSFIHRQTLAGQVRFTTTELSELEAKIATAAEGAVAIELAMFDDLAAAVTASAAAIKDAANALADLDVTAGLAEIAVERQYVRPQVDQSLDFVIEGGRHPVVEQFLAAAGEPFIANDCNLSSPSAESEGRIYLLTGPNMAGKSTYLRQNALIVILAQMGSFVPARQARLGVVDRLFSRVGAADDIARGRSTFMVEMVETAAILNQAGRRSLVILDEIGRGTATFDGLSIAWATIEHLHESNKCRALFATHFHELTALAASLPRVFNATMRVKEWQGEVVFLHEVMPGAADRSYGIQVAKLAGLPLAVIERAQAVLARLEAGDRASPHVFDDLPLFAAARGGAGAAVQDAASDRLMARIESLHPDDMSPRDALEALYQLKAIHSGKDV
jgi:DNA mismatch repair protein MutS